MTEFTIAILAVIGALFLFIWLYGVMHNNEQALIALDQWLAVCFLDDSYADETISAWAHRKQHRRTERFINWLFSDPMHCESAYASEKLGNQNAPEYKR